MAAESEKHSHHGNKSSEGSRSSHDGYRHSDSRESSHSSKHRHGHQGHQGHHQLKRGLRLLIGTANLGKASPDAKSIEQWLPRHGRVHELLGSESKSRHAIVGDSGKSSWKHVDHHGHFEVIVLGTQESIPGAGSVVATATGLSGNSRPDREEEGVFSRALGAVATPLGALAKPVDALAKGMDAVLNTGGDAMGFVGETVGTALGETTGANTNELRDLVQNRLGKDDYALLSNFQRGEMMLFVFVRKDIESLCSIKVTAENAGVGKLVGTKGGIAATLTVGSTRIAFLTMHLQAQEGKAYYDRRNADIAEILQGTRDPTLTAHHAFVLGDLNFRISPPRSAKGEEPTKKEATFASQKMISSKDWTHLNKYDELNTALAKKDCLVGFQTPFCDFYPTYKVDKRHGFHYDWKRIPSYTDRILWKSNQESRSVEALVYEPISHFDVSDHKPIRGVFFLPERRSIKLDPKHTIFHIRIKKLKCKNLKPVQTVMHADVNTFLRFKFDPSSILLKPKSPESMRTETILTSDRPLWTNKEFHFQCRIASENDIAGAYLQVHSMMEYKIMTESLIGSALLDLEHLVRQSCSQSNIEEKMKIPVEKTLIRNGKDVGKFYCDLEIYWSHEK